VKRAYPASLCGAESHKRAQKGVFRHSNICVVAQFSGYVFRKALIEIDRHLGWKAIFNERMVMHHGSG
jgi:hypothetical protein